jgi:hypothetical protein
MTARRSPASCTVSFWLALWLQGKILATAADTAGWVRVRAKAPKDENDGAWSQPAMKIVP